MKQYVLVFEYDVKKFMDLEKIIVFKKNLEMLKGNDKSINLIFFGEGTREELAAFMGYFNSLVGEELCHIAISSTTKEIVTGNGINNKSVKLSARTATELKNKKFDAIVKEYYPELEDAEIRLLPTRNWENLILDL